MERDYPVGHPAASDYKGEPYTPPRAPHAEDFAPDSAARGGRNIGKLDTPDGSHARTVQESKDNAARTLQAEPAAEAQPAPASATGVDSNSTTFTLAGQVENT